MKRKLLFREYLPNGKFHYWGFVRDGAFIGPSDPKGKHQQFTGLYDKNDKEIYELCEINCKYRVEFRYNRYILQYISNKDIFLEFNQYDEYEITREYSPISKD